MCGIIGIVSDDHAVDISVMKRMISRVRHRGPDAEGLMVIDNTIAFGHSRLSIIDLCEIANQPMQDGSKRYTIVYNGEVYNFLELRKILENQGYTFRTKSDTEVILYAFICWGTACFKKFNGMFALAIWDNQEKLLVIAKDRFGKKPLYYTKIAQKFIFASELSALLEDPDIKERVSLSIAGLNHYLAIGYILSPLTIYHEIYKLEAATYVCYKNGRIIEKTRYWDYASYFEHPTSQHEVEITEQLDILLEKAVKYRLISDVPVGAFLSGGIDSSGIVAYAKAHIAYDFHTFSVGFHESSYNEANDAKIVAEYLKTVHHEIIPVLYDNEAAIHKCITCYDEPFSDTSLIPMVLVSELASQSVKVVLSGDGADEIFAGYTTYTADALKQSFGRFPQSVHKFSANILKTIAIETKKKMSVGFKLKQFAKGLVHEPRYAHYAWRELHDENERIALIGEKYKEEIQASHPFFVFRHYYDEVNGLDMLHQHLYVDAKTWLADDILVKVDRATMAFGLEARSPYLDAELVEYVATIPSSLKVHHHKSKYILKRVLARHLPVSTVEKKKSGFNAPINAWMGKSQENEFRSFNKYVWNKNWTFIARIERN